MCTRCSKLCFVESGTKALSSDRNIGDEPVEGSRSKKNQLALHKTRVSFGARFSARRRTRISEKSRTTARSKATTIEVLAAGLEPPIVDQQEVLALIESGSLRSLLEQAVPGKGVSQPSSGLKSLPKPPKLRKNTISSASDLRQQIAEWETRLLNWTANDEQHCEEWAARARHHEHEVTAAWRRVITAKTVLAQLPNVSDVMVKQHDELVRRLNQMSPFTEKVDSVLEQRRLDRQRKLPQLTEHEISLVLDDLQQKLSEGLRTVKEVSEIRLAASATFSSLSGQIAKAQQQSASRHKPSFHHAGPPIEKPSSWSRWLAGTRKYLASLGFDEEPAGIPGRVIDDIAGHLEVQTLRLVNRCEAIMRSLTGEHRGDLASMIDYLEGLAQQAPGTTRSRISEWLVAYQEFDSQIGQARADTQEIINKVNSDHSELKTLLYSLSRLPTPKGSAFVNADVDLNELYAHLSSQESSDFAIHTYFVKKLAMDYELRLSTKREAKAAQLEKQKLEIRETRRDLEGLISKNFATLHKMEHELKELQKTAERRKPAVKETQKKLRRKQEDLLEAVSATPARRQKLEKDIRRLEEDLEDLQTGQKQKSLKLRIDQLMQSIKEAESKLRDINKLDPEGRQSRGPEPTVGYIKTSHDFEHFLADWMRWVGWVDARVMPIGPDGGVDVKARGALGQAKYYDHPVGIEYVQRHLGVAGRLKPRGRIFLAKNGYTQQAIEFAESEGMVLLEMSEGKNGQARAVGVTKLAKEIIAGFS